MLTAPGYLTVLKARLEQTGRRLRPALALRQAQGEDDFSTSTVEILILSLSKDEDFGSPAEAVDALSAP